MLYYTCNNFYCCTTKALLLYHTSFTVHTNPSLLFHLQLFQYNLGGRQIVTYHQYCRCCRKIYTNVQNVWLHNKWNYFTSNIFVQTCHLHVEPRLILFFGTASPDEYMCDIFCNKNIYENNIYLNGIPSTSIFLAKLYKVIIKQTSWTHPSTSKSKDYNSSYNAWINIHASSYMLVFLSLMDKLLVKIFLTSTCFIFGAFHQYLQHCT